MVAVNPEPPETTSPTLSLIRPPGEGWLDIGEGKIQGVLAWILPRSPKKSEKSGQKCCQFSPNLNIPL
ncbi:hypothetical protein NON20_18020 [Synechocystis sp. B12]|nr:hypothetical protein NON20_18020 [Synechocystis sp. B12]